MTRAGTERMEAASKNDRRGDRGRHNMRTDMDSHSRRLGSDTHVRIRKWQGQEQPIKWYG